MRTYNATNDCNQIRLKANSTGARKKECINKHILELRNPQQDKECYDSSFASSVIDSKNFHADIQNLSVENIKSIVDQINEQADPENEDRLKYKRK